MKFSIITPSLNQSEYIERTIQSVLSQKYVEVEYFIIDGGSNDLTMNIIHKYTSKVSKIIIEKDSGQADAINKGLRLSTGEIIGWLNSDDTYKPNTLKIISDIFYQNPEVEFIYGNSDFINEKDEYIQNYPSFQIRNDKSKYMFWKGWPIPQPSTFFRRGVFEKIGFLNENLKYAIDFEYFLRISLKIQS